MRCFPRGLASYPVKPEVEKGGTGIPPPDTPALRTEQVAVIMAFLRMRAEIRENGYIDYASNTLRHTQLRMSLYDASPATSPSTLALGTMSASHRPTA